MTISTTAKSEGVPYYVLSGDCRFCYPWYDIRNYIRSVVIEDSITSIGYYAFWDCTNLTSITIPNSVTYLGDYAFNNCINLKDGMVKWEKPLSALTWNSFPNTTPLTLHVLVGTKALYQAANTWRNFGTIVEYEPT